MRFHIHRIEACESTNDVARELAAAGAPEGTVVVAREQTAGRGTKGRSWHSAPGLGLYVSVLLRPAFVDVAIVPLAAGLAARDAVASSHGLETRLRWPNDILAGGRKLGGILCESVIRDGKPEIAVLGLGLNVSHGPGDFPPEIAALAVSIAAALGRPADPDRLFDALLAALDGRLAALARGETAALMAAFNGASAFRPGDPVLVDSRPFLYDGIDADGLLRVRDEAGVLRRFASAELRNRLYYGEQ